MFAERHRWSEQVVGRLIFGPDFQDTLDLNCLAESAFAVIVRILFVVVAQKVGYQIRGTVGIGWIPTLLRHYAVVNCKVSRILS